MPHRFRACNHMASPIKANSRPENPSSAPSSFIETSSFFSSNRIPESSFSSDDTLYKTPPTWSLSFWASRHHLKSNANANVSYDRGENCLTQPAPIYIIITQKNHLVRSDQATRISNMRKTPIPTPWSKTPPPLNQSPQSENNPKSIKSQKSQIHFQYPPSKNNKKEEQGQGKE